MTPQPGKITFDVQVVTPKEYIDVIEAHSTINLRRICLIVLLSTFVGSHAITLCIFFLQGFSVGGFKLADPLLKWLGGATVGQVAGLLIIAFGSIFRGREVRQSTR